MFYHLGRMATRYRWLIVGFWMVAVAVALPFAPQTSGVLHSGGFVGPDIESERGGHLLVQKVPLHRTKVLPELYRRLQPISDLRMRIGGGRVFNEDIQSVSERDLRRAEMLAFPFAIIALLLVFRSVVAAVLPALVGGAAVVVSLALIFGLGQITNLSIFVLNITTLFGLGLGVDYSLFMVSRFREELAHGRDVEEAVAITVATAGRAVTFSGLTVSIGLVGLVFFSINMLRSVGMGGVLVVLMAVFAAITLLPAVLAIIGTRVNAFPVPIPKP